MAKTSRIKMSKYKYTPEMREISGFGGGYEETCRAMVVAGLEWLDQNPQANPEFSHYSNVYGIINKENDDAKALSEAVVAAANHDCTGAMHQATISHILWIKKNGWDKYVENMTKPEAED